MLLLPPQILMWKVGGGMKPRFHQTTRMCAVCEFKERCTHNMRNIIYLKIKYVHELCFQFLFLIYFISNDLFILQNVFSRMSFIIFFYQKLVIRRIPLHNLFKMQMHFNISHLGCFNPNLEYFKWK